MAEKRIDITAKGVNSDVTTKEKVTSVSIKQIAADIVKNKQYNTSVPNTRLKVTLTGFGEEVIPNDSNFKRLSDQINQTDFFLKALFKGFEEPQQATDLFNIVASYKRVFNEALISSNLISKEINKVFADNLNIEQLIVFNSFKLFNETLISEELSVYSLNKLLLHNTTNADITVYTTGKNVLEDQSSIDLFSRVVNYNRIFNDFSSCTDDFCEVCPDDDQVATFTKVVKDFPEASDLFVRSYTKPFLETQSITDTDPLFAIGVNKVELKSAIDNGHQSVFTKRLSSEFSYSDFIFRSPQKVIQENLFNLDLIAKNLNLSKLEEVNSQDDFTFESSFIRIFDNESNTIDSNQIIDFNKILTDQGIYSEAISLSPSSIYNDLGLSTEQITNNPSKLLLSEKFALEEISTFIFTNRILEDEAQNSDSGLINNQSYFAEAYTTPGYVGSNTTF